MTHSTLKSKVALLLCGAAMAALPALAQTETPPPPPAQTDGAPPPQPRGGGPGNPARRLEMMQRELNLSTDQTAQVKSILDAQQTKMEALRSNTALSQDDRRTQMMAMRQEEQTKIKAVLTPEQVTKYEAMQARMRERMGRRPPPDGAAPPPPPPPSNQL